VTRLALAIALAAAVAATAVPSEVAADPEDDRAIARAKKLHREGDKLFALGKFAGALEKFEQAFEAKPIPAFLFNIGQCHRNLGDYDAALFSFRKYLKLAPDAKNRDAVLEYIDEVEREKQRATANDLDLIAPEPDPEPDPPRRDEVRTKPIYKKWWFWGGIAAAGVGVGTAVFLASGGGAPDTDLGNIDFGR
jgi:tetratricopeptide (TPR) repeat protein